MYKMEGENMLKYMTGIITGIGIALLAAVLLSPQIEDLNDMWREMSYE